MVILDNCEHVVDAAADLAVRLLDAAPGLRILCTSQVPLDVDGETVVRARTARPRRRRRAVHPSGHRAAQEPEPRRRPTTRCTICAVRSTGCRWRSSSPRPGPRRCRSRRSPDASTTASTCLSDPTSRRPERRRALKATIRLELRAVVPRRPARPVGAGHVRRWRTAAGRRVRPRRPRRAGRRPRSTSSVASPAARSSSSTTTRRVDAGRYRLLDSIRAFALDAMTDAGLTDARPRRPRRAGSPTRRRRRPRVSAAVDQAEHLAFARDRAGQHRRRAGVVRARTTRCCALGIVNGFGWAWVVLGDSRGAQRILTALDAAGDAAAPRDRATRAAAGGVDRGVDRRPRTGPRPHRRRRRARRGDRRRRPAGALLLLPRLRRVARRRVPRRRMALTDRSRALYAGLDRPWDLAANGLFAARAAISAGDERAQRRGARRRSSTGCAWSTTRGCTSAATRCSASWPACSTASTTPSTTSAGPPRPRDVSGSCRRRRTRWPASDGPSARPATTTRAPPRSQLASTRPRPSVTCAWRRSPASTSGGCCAPWATTRRRAAALESAAAWHRDAGGGEQAALGECLLAAMDAADGRARRRPNVSPTILDAARVNDEAHVEVFALDALARIAAGDGDTTPREPCAPPPIGAWRPPPTSSPTSIAPTPATKV